MTLTQRCTDLFPDSSSHAEQTTGCRTGLGTCPDTGHEAPPALSPECLADLACLYAIAFLAFSHSLASCLKCLLNGVTFTFSKKATQTPFLQPDFPDWVSVGISTTVPCSHSLSLPSSFVILFNISYLSGHPSPTRLEVPEDKSPLFFNLYPEPLIGAP